MFILTGTRKASAAWPPGRTLIEVEIEGIGVLRNTVVAA